MLFERQRVLLPLLDAWDGQSGHFAGQMSRFWDVFPKVGRLSFTCVGNAYAIQVVENQGIVN